MFSNLKKLSDLVSPKPNSKKLVLIEAQSYLETEIQSLTMEIETVPEGRLPSRKLGKAIKGTITRANEILEPIGKQAQELENYQNWLQLDCHFRVITLDRYTTLINSSDSITPFATFSEIQKIKDKADSKLTTELTPHYQNAIKALFCHPLFIQTLTDRMDKKIQILGETIENQENLERKRIQLFANNYEESKKWNPKLIENAYIVDKMNEIEAILFLHTQSSLIHSGNHKPTEDLVDYINFWANYLNELTADEQTQKAVLLQATNSCSEACNKLA